jgi:hypothetical protein
VTQSNVSCLFCFAFFFRWHEKQTMLKFILKKDRRYGPIKQVKPYQVLRYMCVIEFVSVSMTFQAVFSTLLTMGYCYLYLFPLLSKRCFQLFSQWYLIVRRVENTAWKVMETDTKNNTSLWEELKTTLGKSWKQIQITIPHCEKSWKHRLESHGNRYK